MSRDRRGLLQRVGAFRELGLAMAVLAVVGIVVLCGKGDRFFGVDNQISLWRQVGLLGTFAVGEAVVIIAGGIDLSVGSVIAFAGILGTMAMRALAGDVGYNQAAPAGVLLAGLAVSLLAGLAVGLFHALLINRLKLPPFIATLGTLAGLRSAAELISHLQPIMASYSNFRALSKGITPLWIFAVVALSVGFLMRRTVTGRQILALGGNEEAARLSGLNTARLKTVTYGLSGVLAGLAGAIYAAYSGQGDPRAGVAYELQAVAAAVVGGCSLTGGSGSIPGVCLGVILLQVTLNAILVVVQRDATQWQGLVVGVVVILAVALNHLRQQRLARVG